MARLALPQGTTGIAVHLTQIDQDEFTYAADDWYQAIRFQASKPMLVTTEDNRPDLSRQRLNKKLQAPLPVGSKGKGMGEHG